MTRKAFTLIELLVVIAIIAILAAILFPVFAQAKDAAKKTQSISNMKQFGTAIMMYAADYDDMLSQSAYPQRVTTPTPGIQIISVYDLMQPYMKNLQILVSPSDETSGGQDWAQRLIERGALPATVRRASYIPNLGLFGDNLCGTPFKSAFTPTTSHSSLPEPVQTIMFFDGYIKRNTGGVTASLDFFNFLGMARHADGLVINFADSSARTLRWGQVASLASSWQTQAGSRTGAGGPFYSWRTDTVNCGTTGLCKNSGNLQTVPSVPVGFTLNGTAGPYNDLHGVPGTNITDSEDTTVCP